MFKFLLVGICLCVLVFLVILFEELNSIKKWKQKERKKNIEVISRIALEVYADIKKQKKILH